MAKLSLLIFYWLIILISILSKFAQFKDISTSRLTLYLYSLITLPEGVLNQKINLFCYKFKIRLKCGVPCSMYDKFKFVYPWTYQKLYAILFCYNLFLFKLKGRFRNGYIHQLSTNSYLILDYLPIDVFASIFEFPTKILRHH